MLFFGNIPSFDRVFVWGYTCILVHAKGLVMLLNDSQVSQINSAIFTHEYTVEGNQDFTSQFESDTGFENGTDIGGILVYMRGDELLAFFDYEQSAGTVFKMPWMA